MSAKFTIVLDNVRSAWNVGSVIRTCDALGADLFLIGYTPLPLGKNLELIKKTSIGAEKFVNWKHYDHFQNVLNEHPTATNFAIEITENSENLLTYLNQKNPVVGDIFLWFGNEIHGVSQDFCNLADKVFHLPMLGSKESLNVASTVCAVGYLMLFDQKSF